jgi:hypothetical protein
MLGIKWNVKWGERFVRLRNPWSGRIIKLNYSKTKPFIMLNSLEFSTTWEDHFKEKIL